MDCHDCVRTGLSPATVPPGFGFDFHTSSLPLMSLAARSAFVVSQSLARAAARLAAIVSPAAHRVLTLGVMALALLAPAFGQTTSIWTGSNLGDFTTPQNWSGGSMPVDDLTSSIARVDSGSILVVTGPRSVAGLYFTGSNAGIGGTGPLTLGASGVSLFGSMTTGDNISLPLILGASQTFFSSTTGNRTTFTGTIDLQNFVLTLTVGGPQNMSLTGNMSGTGSVLISSSGSGALAMSGNSTYSGGTTLASGNVTVSGNSPFGTGTLTITGATLSGSGTLSNQLVIPTSFSGGGSVVFAAPLSLTADQTFTGNANFSGAISGNASLTVSGGTTSLSGTNTYTGDTTVQSGAALQLTGAGALPGSSTIIMAGGTLKYGDDASAAVDFSGRISTAAGQAYNADVSSDVTAKWAADLVSAGGTLTKTGAGVLELSGNNTYSGATTISAGELRFETRDSLQGGDSSKWTSSNLVVASGAAATFAVGGATGFSSSDLTLLLAQASFASGASIGFDTTNAGGTYSLSALGDGAGGALGLVKSGAGTLMLTGANTYTGGTTVKSGTLQLAAGDTTLSTTGTVNVTGGTLDLGGSTLTNAVTLNGATSVIQNGNLVVKSGTSFAAGTVSATLSGTAGLTVTNTTPSTVVLSGTNTYTGTTSVGGSAILEVSNLADTGTASPLGTSGSISLSGGRLRYTGAAASSNRAIANTGSNTSTLESSGTGPLTLTGTLALGAKGGTMRLAGSTAGNVYAGVISGAATLNKIDNGTWQLNGTNTYAALTTVSAGILKVGNTAALGTTTFGTTVSSGGTLDLNGISVTGEALTLNGAGFNSGGALTNSSSTASTFSGLVTLGSASRIEATSGNILISNAGTITGSGFGLTLGGAATGSRVTSIIGIGAGTVTKTDAGTWILAGANTYTGATTVSAGLLQVDGSLAAGSALTVANGGTLGGTGTVNGAATVSSGGTLAPGVSPGVLNFGGSLNLLSGSTTAIEIAGTTRGTGFDGLNITGATIYGGTLAFNFTGTFATGTTFDVFHLTGTPTGSFDFVTGAGGYVGNFVDAGGIWTLTSGGQALTFDQTTGSLSVGVATAVPEPMTYAWLMSTAVFGCAVWRRAHPRKSARA